MMKIEYRGILLSIVFACLLLQACDKPEDVKPKPEVVDRTVLIYIAADNNLDDPRFDSPKGFAIANIESMLKGMHDVDGRVVVYYDSRSSSSSLMTVKRKGDKCVLDTIEQYSEEDSSSPEVLSRVAKRVQELYPAESHGLFLWSHASGWLPKGASFSGSRVQSHRVGNLPLTKTWGQDLDLGDNESGSSGMEILELLDALPYHYDFILFDCCLMATIEVFYELRNKADYIIASPVEILVAGFPYEQIMPFLWRGEDDLKQVCWEFYNFYQNHPDGGVDQSGVITLIETEYLDDLAAYISDVLKGKLSEIAVMSRTDFDRYPLIDFRYDVFFDLGDYIKQFADDEEYKTFEMLMNNMVYKWSTTNFWGDVYPVDKYSGISTYIPLNSWQNMNEKYFELSWSKLMYE